MADTSRNKGKTHGVSPSPGAGGNAGWLTTGNGYAEEMLRFENTLTATAKLRRRLFAAHYIKTTNAKASALVAGFKESSAGSRGVRLLQEPYVQQLIADMLRQSDLEAIMSRQEIMLGLKTEALNTEAGNQGARVSAYAHMAKIYGMMDSAPAGDGQMNGGVMVVPEMGSVSDWGEAASSSQAKLKQEVRD